MNIAFSRSDDVYIKRIRSGDEQAMERVYFNYRDEFLNWAKRKFSLSHEEALEQYQESVTILFEKIVNGSLHRLEGSLKSYLFGIGKNRIMQGFDAENRQDKHQQDLSEHYRFLAEDQGARQIYEKAKKATKEIFKTLEEPCKTVLKLFYFDKKPMTVIAEELGYKNEGVARTTKKRCLEKIRDKFLKPTTHA